MNKRALFIINSISNGGAERVCINMADELLKQNFEVDFILLKPIDNINVNYDINKKINLFSLECNKKNKIFKLVELMFKVKKMNKIIIEREKVSEYKLITCHLPMAIILTRFSKIKNKSIYVFHNKIKTFEIINHRIFSFVFRKIFKGKKISCVSNGVMNEGIDSYGLDKKFVRTIYNPIDLLNIEKLSNEPVEISKYSPYILHIGRFNKAKRQDRAIDIFYKGKFYEEYKLLFCGTGDLENVIRKKVKDYHLEKSVVFLGWQKNVYKWIKNSKIVLCTSDYEAFPMNLIEAFSCGAKVISSNCNYGPNEIMTGSFKKFLVKPDNIDEYIEKINTAIIDYPIEKNKVLLECNPSVIINKYLEFYKEDIF